MPGQCVSGGVSDAAAVVKIVLTQYINNTYIYIYNIIVCDISIHVYIQLYTI